MLSSLIVVVIISSIVAFAIIIPSCLKLWQNRYLYKSILTRYEQSKIEKNIDFLRRVIVIADRIDMPTEGFFRAVSDNTRQGVEYTFFVSRHNNGEDLESYIKMFKYIEESARSEDQAREYAGLTRRLPGHKLLNFYRVDQEWSDYPYICYECALSNAHGASQILMYRGNEIGAGLADVYVKISPEMAYSFVQRVDALRKIIGYDEERFIDSRRAKLNNAPLNIIQFRR